MTTPPFTDNQLKYLDALADDFRDHTEETLKASETAYALLTEQERKNVVRPRWRSPK